MRKTSHIRATVPNRGTDQNFQLRIANFPATSVELTEKLIAALKIA